MTDTALNTSRAALKTKIDTAIGTASIDDARKLAKIAKLIGESDNTSFETAVNTRINSLATSATTDELVKLAETIGFVTDTTTSSALLDLSAIQQNLVPDTTDIRNLGSASKQWDNLYLNAGTIQTTPSAADHIVNKAYVDSRTVTTGDIIPDVADTHDLGSSSKKYVEVHTARVLGLSATPTVAGEAASKAYVDSEVGALTSVSTSAPSSPNNGDFWFDSVNASLLISYDDGSGSQWVEVSGFSAGHQHAASIPNISSITGTINDSNASNLVFTLTNNTTNVDVVFSEGGTAFHTVTGQSVSSGGTFTLATPSQVYGQTAGDTISISINNSDGTASGNAITKTVVGLPSGGTITTDGSYRVHTFTSSGNFVVPTGFTANAETLIVAGGAGGGVHSGAGGGAGGLLYYGAETPKTPNGSAIGITAQTYGIVVGAGGASSGGPYNGAGIVGTGFDGANSSALGYAAIGGGGGGSGNGSHVAGRNGGSGGGGSRSAAAGSGTSGQGNAGGFPNITVASYPGGGGGGAGAVGGNGSTTAGGPGGIGLQYSISGSATYYAGGGGGTLQDVGGGIQGAGGNGGGGNGMDSAAGQAGTTNTGGGGGGGHYTASGGAGGSGIVIIRYAV
jgi:hypothetical protein|tara:strand:- start:233 stop:2098 length:1866 start_codon:yes stop_codon:yes gene_type:complete